MQATNQNDEKSNPTSQNGHPHKSADNKWGRESGGKGTPPSTPGGNVHGQRQSNGQFPNA